MLTLFARSARRVGVVFAALASVLALFQIVIVLVAASFESSRSFERLAAVVPSFMTRSFSSSLLTLASFRAMSMAGYFHPVVVMIVTQFAIYLASEPAGDVELGLVDALLSRPLRREVLVTRSLLLTMAATLTTVLVMAAASVIGLSMFAPPGVRGPDARTVAVLSAELLMVSWVFGAAALAVAAFARRRATPVAGVGLLALGLYLLEFLGASWKPAAPLARVSPFHYYDGTGILIGRGEPTLDLTVLAGLTVVGIAVGYWRFRQRDF